MKIIGINRDLEQPNRYYSRSSESQDEEIKESSQKGKEEYLDTNEKYMGKIYKKAQIIYNKKNGPELAKKYLEYKFRHL